MDFHSFPQGFSHVPLARTHNDTSVCFGWLHLESKLQDVRCKMWLTALQSRGSGQGSGGTMAWIVYIDLKQKVVHGYFDCNRYDFYFCCCCKYVLHVCSAVTHFAMYFSHNAKYVKGHFFTKFFSPASAILTWTYNGTTQRFRFVSTVIAVWLVCQLL